MSKRVVAVIPAEPGKWIGRFGKKSARIPVVAWVALEDDELGVTIWDGLGVWEDGPAEMGSFVDFEGFQPTAGWDR